MVAFTCPIAGKILGVDAGRGLVERPNYETNVRPGDLPDVSTDFLVSVRKRANDAKGAALHKHSHDGVTNCPGITDNYVYWHRTAPLQLPSCWC